MSPAFHTIPFSVFFSNLRCCIDAIAAAKAAKIPSMAAEDAQKVHPYLWQIRCFFFAYSSPLLLCYCCCCPTISPFSFMLQCSHNSFNWSWSFSRSGRSAGSVAIAVLLPASLASVKVQTKAFLQSSQGLTESDMSVCLSVMTAC